MMTMIKMMMLMMMMLMILMMAVSMVTGAWLDPPSVPPTL